MEKSSKIIPLCWPNNFDNANSWSPLVLRFFGSKLFGDSDHSCLVVAKTRDQRLDSRAKRKVLPTQRLETAAIELRNQ